MHICMSHVYQFTIIICTARCSLKNSSVFAVAFCQYFAMFLQDIELLQINDCLLNTTSYGPIHQIPLYRVTDFPLSVFAITLLYIILI